MMATVLIKPIILFVHWLKESPILPLHPICHKFQNTSPQRLELETQLINHNSYSQASLLQGTCLITLRTYVELTSLLLGE